MKLTEILRESLELAWWIEIVTAYPRCIYYFGPFASTEEAERLQAGYIEDLEQEGSQVIMIQIKWCQPQELTAFEGELTEGYECSVSQML
ncbi:MAG: DUF1816 domain-containing protein [Scytonema sp. PMC 1069.18]|nr:DUF1816 domain-containing protein [Scytonema sp. PMC 1069.18]MEC4882927.1 DUF1816 domain-containing protein [Scytonema sp. PMC 1070.18]